MRDRTIQAGVITFAPRATVVRQGLREDEDPSHDDGSGSPAGSGRSGPAVRRTCQAVADAFEVFFFVVAAAFEAFTAFAAVLRCSEVCAPNFLVKRSTRPSVSMSFCRPVKNGWHAEQISRCNSCLVDRVLNVFPQAQRTSTTWYLGWIPSFTATPLKSNFLFYPIGRAGCVQRCKRMGLP